MGIPELISYNVIRFRSAPASPSHPSASQDILQMVHHDTQLMPRTFLSSMAWISSGNLAQRPDLPPRVLPLCRLTSAFEHLSLKPGAVMLTPSWWLRCHPTVGLYTGTHSNEREDCLSCARQEAVFSFFIIKTQDAVERSHASPGVPQHAS